MYTSEEEFYAMKGVIEEHVQLQKEEYEAAINRLQKEIASMSSNIEEKSIMKILSSQKILEDLYSFQVRYMRALPILYELEKIDMCYQEAHKSKGLPQDKDSYIKLQEADSLFNQLKSENLEYKSIVDEMAAAVIIGGDEQYTENLSSGLEFKLSEVEQKYKDKEISKEDLIFDSVMYKAFFNNPEYRNKFCMETPSQKHHK